MALYVGPEASQAYRLVSGIWELQLYDVVSGFTLNTNSGTQGMKVGNCIPEPGNIFLVPHIEIRYVDNGGNINLNRSVMKHLGTIVYEVYR